MFIQFGNRRINISLVKWYKPKDKSTITGTYYQIEFTLLNGEKDELHFFQDKEDRDKFIEKLDRNLLSDLT